MSKLNDSFITDWLDADEGLTHCEHGGLIDADGTVSCEHCDWCPTCEAVRRFDGEDGDTCSVCGYLWGLG